MRRNVLPSVLGIALALSPALGVGADQSGTVRTVYVSVTSASGLPVEGLAARDFRIREGGRPVEVLRAGPAAARMQIAILVDDNGTGLFRQAVTTFVQQTIDRADISIARIVGQPLVLAPFGTSAAGLAAAVASLGAAPATPDGGQLLSGIDEAARQMVRMETSRPVILVLTVGGEEHSGLESRVVLDRIRASGAALHVIVDASPDERQRGRIGRPADLLGPNLHLAEVLGEGPRQSGGSRHETMATGGVVTGIREVLTILRNQYAVTYLLPPGATPTGRLEVSAARPDVAVRAPSGVPTAR